MSRRKKVLIQGPNTLAAFLDTIRIGHHYLQLNETAEKVAEVVKEPKGSSIALIKAPKQSSKRLEASMIRPWPFISANQNKRLRQRMNRGSEELDLQFEQWFFLKNMSKF